MIKFSVSHIIFNNYFFILYFLINFNYLESVCLKEPAKEFVPNIPLYKK